MSDYDMTFDKKIVDDASFDTIFGGEEDNHLLDLVLKEDSDAFNVDERDPEGIEDGTGAIGKGDGLGSDLGPGHDENKPADDSSDQKILVNNDKDLKANDQLNVSDTTGGKVEDGNTVDTDDVHASGTDELVGNDPTPCERHLDDNLDKISNSVDSFDEAAKRLLEEVGDDELPEEDVAPTTTPVEPAPAPEVPVAPAPVEPDPVAPVAAPADAPVPAEVPPTAPDAEVPAPVAPASDAGAPSDLDLLDTEPVAAPEEGCCKEEAPMTIEDLDEAADPVDPEDVNDKVDFGGVEDKSGKIGAGDGLGNDLGPDHDTANKPKDDTSDEVVLPKDDKELKNDQLNTSDEAGASKVEDGGMVKDFANAGEDGEAADDSFKEASVEDLENMPEEEEDEIIDAVEDNDAKSEFTAAELNADEDDEILDMLD